ncbi:MAG: BREX system P-loop protein BrxC [Deltaproteobacteria bacterium]|jgi:hypothetical protein|nr:BREX system P-loop protein BrxC [Deltaproteobacteria bacterium]
MTLNREIYQKDPSQSRLLNAGVASVNDLANEQAMRVLRYELESFVCKGHYEKGLALILRSFLADLDKGDQQKGVWVSGFYGSGKSHFMKMLRALWVNTEFREGSVIRRARDIAALPTGITDLLRELDGRSRRFGGLHAASGTLGSGMDGSVRLALMAIVFRSAGLPEQYPHARFVMWLKQEEIFDKIRASVADRGLDWGVALDNLYVCDELHDALLDERPDVFVSRKDCSSVLITQFPQMKDVSSNDMTEGIRQALVPGHKLSEGASIPLTIVVMDELQQYIGDGDGSSKRALAVQEVVEACRNNINDSDRFMFIGSGQTAMSGTTNIKKLEGRFTVRVELKDSDVDTVIRHVILQKNPDAVASIEAAMEKSRGEVTRHLTGTAIAYRPEDDKHLTADYPILPVRRRFWEQALRALDTSGTQSQLRNQLSMVHKAIQTNLDMPLGNVVPADYLYFDAADKLLQSEVLMRPLYDATMRWRNGSDREKLTARVCGTVFLINRLQEFNKEIGVLSNVDTLSDLLLENLEDGSSGLRREIPEIADNCHLIMKVGDEYHIHSEESTIWNYEFRKRLSSITNHDPGIEAMRNEKIRAKFNGLAKKLTISQGSSKVLRKLRSVFDDQEPHDDSEVCVWVRDGWAVSGTEALDDARKAGNESPTIFVFVPNRNGDDLLHDLKTFKAAEDTIHFRGAPSGAKAVMAEKSIQTMLKAAEGRINAWLDDAFSKVQVFQGGGTEVTGADLREKLHAAGETSLKRLYKKFSLGDHPGWQKVADAIRKGAPDPLREVGDVGEPALNQVCKPILEYMSETRTGKDLRKHFESPPYGWSGDCVDGAILVLLTSDLLKATDQHGRAVPPTYQDKKNFGLYTFRPETITLTAQQRLDVRGLFNEAGQQWNSNEEAASSAGFVEKLLELAARASGDAPRPDYPDTAPVEKIRILGGNSQLLEISNSKDKLSAMIKEWKDAAERIEERWPAWLRLRELSAAAADLKGAAHARAQLSSIEDGRQLLMDPDPVPPLLEEISRCLREEFSALDRQYAAAFDAGCRLLEEDSGWNSLDAARRHEIRAGHNLQDSDRPSIRLETPEELLETVRACPLGHLAEKVAALPGHFSKASDAAALESEPDTEVVRLQHGTFRSEEEIDLWIEKTRGILKAALLKGGPVKIG